MSTKIFVVCLTGIWGAGEQRKGLYNWRMRDKGRSVKREHREERRVGLARALSKLGFCSRAKGFELVHAGRVRLNGITSKNPETPVRLGQDRIEVDGATVTAAGKMYWIFNKPRGVVTTAEDERGRETVYARLPEGLPWMGPVGRLDQASEGLLIFTNDSEWAARITAPESHVDKTYHVQIGALVEESFLHALVSGVTSEDGQVLRAKQAKRIREGEKNSWIEVVLDEGKNRQIRRMLEACGVEVLRLVRVAIGPLELGLLGKGEARELTPAEKRKLDGVRT
jgi:23S rRNA pseudouridine2605 synthase